MPEQKKKQFIPVGIDNFEKLISGNYYFVDKSLFIRELLDSRAEFTLITRPRRFGKTLNLSMVQTFFELNTESKRHLFDNLAITEYPDCMEHQGKYPVIALTFKDMKSQNWDDCWQKIQALIKAEIERHRRHIDPVLSPTERESLNALLSGTASQAIYENALLTISTFLERAYKQKVLILIDEYDSPIHAGYTNGYYEDVINFMRGFMGAGLKGNKSLYFGIATGILRIAKESIFSGLNNLRVCSLVDDPYADIFGFLEHDVDETLHYFDLHNHLADVRSWYNGYQIGNARVYNPWSIINLIDQKGKLQAYWVNTSDNALIKNLLKTATPRMKTELEILMNGGSITKEINGNIVFPDIARSERALWNFLLFCGYLTFHNYHQIEADWFADLSIPNTEVEVSYKNSFKSWFTDSTGERDYTSMLESLVNGQVGTFKKSFERFCRETLSYFDIRGDEPESFYHALVLGMLSSLSQTHEVRSNRESGYGRYDVMIIPKDRSKKGILIEFKSIDIDTEEALETTAKTALKQIEDRGYSTELRALGITDIISLGIAFRGKDSFVLAQ